MQQVYTARDSMDARFLKGLLEQEGINAVVQGEALEETWGDLNLSRGALPSVWVDEADVERATAVVVEYRRVDRENAVVDDADANRTPRLSWVCPRCGEKVEMQFSQCWHCNTQRPPGAVEAMGGPH